MRQTCANCEGESKCAYWSFGQAAHLLARCTDCGANFHGPGQWLPKEWGESSARGLTIQKDPHSEHGHGHGPCDMMDKRQMSLFEVKP